MKKITSALLLCMAIQFSFSQSVVLNIKVYIEGPYYNGQMTPFLNVLGYLPVNQPYNIDPWKYNGTESVGTVPNTNIVDWVLVDVLKPHSDGNQIRFEVMGRKAGFLFKDGFIKDIDGTSNLSIETKMTSGFYIRIHHRNHLSVISAVPMVESGGVFSYDFTLSADQVLGGFLRQKQLSSTIWGMIAADADASGQIDNLDKNEVWLQQQNLTGYYEGDFNMDTQVDMDDKVVKWEPNAGKSSYPVKDTILPLFICGSSSVMLNGLVYGTVKLNDQCWLDRNLGANQVATAYNDPLSYGELFQWGRLMDGHQNRTSATSNVLSSSDDPGHGDFIITDDDPYDWRNPQNNNLWQESTNINNPCPDGWDVPSLTQWQEATTGWTNRTDAFNSLLKLPAAGWRSESAGNVSNAGSWGNYWTTTINATGARGIYFDSFNFNSNTYARASGRSVRCLKTDYVPNNPPAEPSDPNPANDATGVETNINLSWVCTDPDGDDLTYNIYFGNNAVPSLIETSFIGNSWTPGLLNLNTTYYWKIVAYDIYGDSTQSAVWNFTTKIPFACGDILIDTRDSQSYNTVQIGEQCWMAENLNIGTMINGSTNQTDNSTIEKYCYDNNTSNCDSYGGLYQWNEMMQYSSLEGSQGICPEGWHVPTNNEYSNLTDYLGGIIIAGGKMKTTGTIENNTGLWYAPNTGATNSSGFSALPGGYLLNLGNFVQLGYYADFWSSTDSWYRELRYNFEEVHQNIYDEYSGFSVRCLKDSTPPTWSCGDPLNDPRDGQTYNTVQIGNQCWMAENLNIGTMINGSVNQTQQTPEVIEKYCYDNNTDNCDTYGGLYQWNEVMQYSTTPGVQGICPAGWHLPTDAEWTVLTTFLGGEEIAGGKMKTTGTIEAGTGLWYAPNTGATNQSSFTALPGGARDYEGSISGPGANAYFWSSTENNTDLAWLRSLDYNYAFVTPYYVNKISGFNIRCLKDTPPTWSCGDPLNDDRDGQIYNTVQIGEQCWMAENLNVGTMIPGANWMADDGIIEKYCYANNTGNCDTYGGLYQWDEMMEYSTTPGVQGICPDGWHSPDDSEWTVLTDFLGGEDIAGHHLREVGSTHWAAPNNGATNSSGFTAIGGGRGGAGGYFDFQTHAYFWSSTVGSLGAWAISVASGYPAALLGDNGISMGFSVRCIKDSPPPTWSCGEPLLDTRDNQTYNTVQIGEQCWMAENLKTTLYQNGDLIPNITLSTEWNSFNEGAYVWYNNDNSWTNLYGGLYNWFAVADPRGLCPIGWHIPEDYEWTALTNYLGGAGPPCGKILKSCRQVNSPLGGDCNTSAHPRWNEHPDQFGTDEYAFYGIPGGERNENGLFQQIGITGSWWSTTEVPSVNRAWARDIDFNSDGIFVHNESKFRGYSVRCLKD